MSASTLLSYGAVPRVLSDIYDPQGGGSGVTSAVAGDGIAVSSATGDVTVSQSTPTTDYGTGVAVIVAGAGAPLAQTTFFTSALGVASAVDGLWVVTSEVYQDVAGAGGGGYSIGVQAVSGGPVRPIYSANWAAGAVPAGVSIFEVSAVVEIPAGGDITMELTPVGGLTSTTGFSIRTTTLRRLTWA